MEFTYSTESYLPSNTLQQKIIMSTPSYPNNMEQQTLYQDTSGSNREILNPQDNLREIENNETLSTTLNTIPQQEVAYVPRQVFPNTQNLNIPRMRRQMIASIMSYLRQRPGTYPAESSHQIRSIAHRLEHALYTQAGTLDEYRDISTLPRRLQVLSQHMPRQNVAVKRSPLRETTIQSDTEIDEIRRRMTVDILNHLQQRALRASEACHRRLPAIARMFEAALWKMSTNIDEYRDLRTLKTRLQSLAIANGAQAPRTTG